MDAAGPAARFTAADMWQAVSDRHADTANGERPVYNSETVYTFSVTGADPRTLKTTLRGDYPGILPP